MENLLEQIATWDGRRVVRVLRVIVRRVLIVILNLLHAGASSSFLLNFIAGVTFLAWHFQVGFSHLRLQFFDVALELEVFCLHLHEVLDKDNGVVQRH